MMVWLNTGLVPEDVASINISDRGFTLGDGVFETFAVQHGRVLRLKEHLDRLRLGCAVLKFSYPDIDLVSALYETVTSNDQKEGVLRLTLSRGCAARGLLPPIKSHPTLVITAASRPERDDPACCYIARGTRRNEHSPLSRIKALSYLDNILALQEAVDRGGNEALLLNTSGNAVCSSRANLFMVQAETIYTPFVEDGALPGIMRSVLMEKMPIVEKKLQPLDLYQADEIFLTNSLGIRSVREVDGRGIGQDNNYPVTRKVSEILAYQG